MLALNTLFKAKGEKSKLDFPPSLKLQDLFKVKLPLNKKNGAWKV